MAKNKRGLIVNVSSWGGKAYLFNVAYGVGKAGCDRMAKDCAIELKAGYVDPGSIFCSLCSGSFSPIRRKTSFLKTNVMIIFCAIIERN
jgi:dehydrogenase/reductase SDR family protein 1